MTPHLRLARPVTDLERAEAQYVDGLGLRPVGRFENHDGFDGVMLAYDDSAWHLEFTVCRDHPVAPAPTAEDLLVLYLPDEAEWSRRCATLVGAGFVPVTPFNPWWQRHGRSFADADGYRVVLCRAAWEAAPAGPDAPAAPGPVVEYDDLEHALYWVSAQDVGQRAFVSRETGRVVLRGEGIEEPPPEDLDDGSVWVRVPDKRELDLGRRLVQRFADERLTPALAERVDACFRRRGAYARFKDLLEDHGHLQHWFAFEADATEAALREWCASVGIRLGPRPIRPQR